MEIKDYIIGILFSLVVALGLWLSVEIGPNKTTTVKETVDSTKTVERDSTAAPDTSRSVEADSARIDTVYDDTTMVTEVDTFITKPDSQENSEYTKIRKYETSISDSLISGTIQTTVQGYLIDQNLTYTPEYPLQITVNTRTVVNRRVTKTIQPKGYPSVGVYPVTDLKTLKGIKVSGSWTFSNGNEVGYMYNPVMKTHTVGLSYNLRNLFK